MGFLVVAMVEVSFLSFFLFLLWLVVVSGCDSCGWMWMWRCLSAVCFLFLFLLVVVVVWVVGFWWVGGWCQRCRQKEREIEERETGERGKIKKILKNNKETLFK